MLFERLLEIAAGLGLRVHLKSKVPFWARYFKQSATLSVVA